jgi:hypothetical protein
MSGWPELPSAGELVRLALPLPPTLGQAAGYSGAGQLVAMHWTPYGDELIITDGTITTTGWWPAWTTLVQHPLGAVILGPYQLGSSDTEAEHWLLADQLGHTLDVGLARDVRQLLATQPSELAAIAEILGADRTRELIEDHLRTPPRPPDARQVHAQLARSSELVAELKRWLDDTFAQIQP